MTRLGSFRALTTGGASERLFLVFDDALVEVGPSRSSVLADLVAPVWIRKVLSRSLDNRENEVGSTSKGTSSQEIAQQFKGSKRIAFSEIEGAKLQQGALSIRTGDGDTAHFVVDNGRQVADLLGRALGPRFHDLSPDVSA